MRRWNSGTPPRCLRGALVVAALMLATAALPLSRAQARTHAQQQEPEHGSDAKCGAIEDSSYAAVKLTDFAQIFSDSTYADFRAKLGIATLPEHASREVVRDSKVCQRLRPAVHRALRTVYPNPGGPEKWDLMFFRLGDYYAVSATPKLEPGQVVNGYSPLFTFRAATLEYLGLING